MPQTIAPYPGGKSKLADWIVSIMPDHHCYCEPFGGMAGLLINKPRSEVEVYNDLDSHLYNFFKVLRDRPDELVEWLQHQPYSREYHYEYAEKFYGDDEMPDDSVARAGIFFTLRYTQFGSKYHTNSGFGFSKVSSDAKGFENAKQKLHKFADRLMGVYIDNLDWKDCIQKYDFDEDDDKDTLFYCDPPYVGTEGHYVEGGFNHDEFVNYLSKINGYIILSYDNLPDALDENQFIIKSRDSKFYIGNGRNEETKETTEHLILNYDPSEVKQFHSAQQKSLFSSDEADSASKLTNDKKPQDDFLETVEEQEKEDDFLAGVEP